MTSTKELYCRGPYPNLINSVESVLSQSLRGRFTLYPYRSTQEEQTAQFLSDTIAFYLEQRVPFRRLKQALLKDIHREYIEGVKVVCSGRMGGRSKKAQRARKEGFQWGQTSSHVFSSKLSFASRSALTPLGKIGIKVWVSFHKEHRSRPTTPNRPFQERRHL
jgi:small subunit ribosomal protein S3